MSQVRRDVAKKKSIEVEKVSQEMVSAYRTQVEDQEREILKKIQTGELKMVEFIDQSNDQILVKKTQEQQEATYDQLEKDFKQNR